ncbi:methyltransferase [uncultured Phenylobacterium sp.]|uniref:methyltransferase n=1 Tax=uncultured Phenylobacterium sp. TaxID=349273 RepID=UPI0025DDDF70|nr:methyltransferase [uncultured Phenylobacterium sp.]
MSSLAEDLFLHSAYPPNDPNAVFFGPDTYRFARFLRQVVGGAAIRTSVDVGTGTAAGANTLARACAPERVIATDVNATALHLARANLAAAGIDAELRCSRDLDALGEPVDLIVANPPFIAGTGDRVYRDGGGLHDTRRSLDWALAGADRLAPGGRFLLYTGSAIVAGRDRLREALEGTLERRRFTLAYEEIDPDIFGEQLCEEAYRDVERIATIGAVITGARKTTLAPK